MLRNKVLAHAKKKISMMNPNPSPFREKITSHVLYEGMLGVSRSNEGGEKASVVCLISSRMKIGRTINTLLVPYILLCHFVEKQSRKRDKK